MPLLSHSRQAGLVVQILPSLAIAVIVGLFAFSLIVPMSPADAGAQTAFPGPQEPKKAQGHTDGAQSPAGQSPAGQAPVGQSPAGHAPVVEPAANVGPAKGILTPADNHPEVDPMVAHDGAPFFPSRANTAGQHLTPDMFTKPEACKECHAEIYQQWSASIMGHSWRDPIYRALLKLSSEATHGAVDRFCIGCHSPIGLVTGTADAVKGDIGVECTDVNCEACHTISAITGAGNGSWTMTPNIAGRPVKFGPRNDAFSPFHDTTHSDLHTKPEFCASCHNVTHPFNRLPVERTYDEWRDSPYNIAGVLCQDCHMTPGPGQENKAGKSAPEGKERPHIYAHTFAGANVTLHQHFGDKDAEDRARKMLETAATLEFVELPASLPAGQKATVKMRVTNVGAGHKLPTGFPEGREVWVDFKVRDADGNEIYRLGKIEHGHTEPGTRSFKATLGDPQGNVVTFKVWEADRVLSDTRLLPKGWAVVDFTFPVPPGVRGPLQFDADLDYASFPQAVLDELLGPGTLEGRIVKMTHAAQSMPVVATGTVGAAVAPQGSEQKGER